MAGYIQLPDGSYFQLKPGQDAMTGFYAASQLYPDAFGVKKETPEVAPKTGLGSALIGGAQRYGSQFRTGLGGGSAAAEAGVARMEEIEKARPSQVSLEKVKQAYQKDGVLSAAGEALGQVPYALAEQVPQLASMGAGARAGAMAGRFFGPVGVAAGTGIGALAGQFLSSYVPTAGANLEAQARAQIAEGKPVDVNPLAAYGAAIPGAALDVFTDRLLLGKGVVGRLMGFTDEQVAKKSAQELEKLASERLLPKLSRGEVSAGTLLKGTAKGTVEIPTEIAQQILERAQAGLPLMNDEALADYGNAAYQAGLLSPLGGLGRISERGGARSEIAQRKKQAADAAFAAQEAAATQPANLLKLFDDYTAAKEEASRLSAAIPASPSKKKKPQDYAKWEEDTAGAREAASDHMENILRPLREEYRQREDLIKPLVAQRQATQAAAQPAAAPAAPPAAPPAPPTVTDLMDQYDALYQQRDQLGAQIQAAAGSGDSTAIIPLHDQWQALTKQVGELGKVVEGAGGTIETADALDKKLAATQKEMAKAAEVGNFDTVRKQAEKLAKLQQMRALVEGRPSRTAVAEQPEVAAPVTEMPAAEELAPKEAPPPSITPYDFPTPYEMFGARSVADLNAPFDLPTPMEMFGDVDLDRATKFVRDTGKANITHLEQGLNVKRQVAAQLLMDLEKAGVVTPLKGNKREVVKETPTMPAAEAPAVETPKVETKPTETPPAGPVQHAIEDVPPVWLPVNELKLSKDVPQFKEGADQEGVVKPLKGEFAKYAVAPIQVWRRLDGSLEIISGRHRWDLAKRSGRQTIAAQIFDESAGFDKKQAATMDAEINIRDDQGTVSDYVNYFQGAQLSKEEANARGLTRGKGEEAIEIATNGSPELIAAHRAKQVSDSLAASIATEAPKDSRIQAVAIKAAQSKSAAEALNLMRAVQVIAPKPAEGGMADMFGFDESAMLEAQEMAKIATQKQREVGQRLSAITGASKNPKLAAAEGIDIKDPEAVKRRIADLRQLKSSWDNWTTNSDLVGEIRAAMKPAEAVEQPQVNMEVTPARLGVDAEDLENAIKQIEALQAETIVGEDNTPKVQALIKELEAAKIINEARADEEISLIGTEEAPLTILKDRLVRLVDLLKAAAARERSAKRNKNKNAPPAEGTLAQDAQDESDDQGAMFSLGTTDAQRRDAENIAKDVSGKLVWQEGKFGLVRGYGDQTGQPLYVATIGTLRAKVDVDNFTGNQIPAEILKKMRQVKKDLEAADAKKHAKNPFVKHDANGLAFSSSVPAEYRGIIEGWKKLLGIDARVYVSTVEDAKADRDKFTGPHRAVGSTGLDPNERGSARYMAADDSYYITYAPSTSKSLELELIAHELGHVHEKDVFKKAPAETQAAIKADYDKWLASNKGKTAREHIAGLRAKTTGKTTTVNEGLQSKDLTFYWSKFGEWYADQVSRWSTTTDKPLTIVEKFFAKLGAAMRRFYTNAMQQKYLPAQSMQKFLDGIAKTAKNNGAIAPNAVDAAMDSGLKKQSPEKTFTGQGSLFRSQGEQAAGMPTAEIEDLIKPFRQLPVAPKITVVQSISELPEKIQAQMERDGTQGAPGMYHPPTETIYLVGDNLIDGADVGKTISHELVGHFGLRGVLGNSYPAAMRSIYQNNKQIKAEANARMQDNPDMSLEVATEESIAERAEKDVSLNWMNRLVNLIRTKLRQWGIWKDAPIGDSEIIRLIRDSHKYVSGVTTKPSETVKALAQVAPTEADIKGHNRVESLYSGRGQKNFKEPVKTIKAYKLFRVKKNEPGKIYPLFIGKNEATAIGEWVPAEHLPTKGFAERPGWHAGILPMAPHLRTKENQMADDRVWAEVEIPADVNWQDVADTQKTRDIRDRVPVGGHYRFKTSKMQGGAWIIGGALKVKRVLSNEEIADILNKAGEKDAATREQMRNPALAEAFAPSGKETAKEGDVLYRSRKPTKSVVAQRTSTADDLMALYTGLTGASSRDATMAGIKDKTNTRALKLRQRIFDQYAALEEVIKKGLDDRKIDALRAQNLMYALRFGQQRSDIVGQTVTSGPPRVRSEKTNAGTEYFYENDAGGPTLVGMAQALEKAKGYKEEDRENAFTVYLAGKRAEQVGWNKLRFDNPVEAENEYKAVLAHLKQNPADKAAFEAAEKIYQNYNAGLLDFLVQTGAMSKQKAAELKQITYVPFYRVDKDGNIRMETGDERRSIRIGNIKSEPRLKELLGDSEQILPVFTSAVQNTSMLINMAMRNQTVKDTAFVLKDLGIASRIVASKGPYADNVVHFRVNGVEHHAIIDNDMYGIPAQMIVEGLEGIKVAMPTIVRMLGVPGDIFRKFTVRNPLYIFRQLVRDPVSAWVQTGTSTVPILDSFSTLAKMATGNDTTAQRLQRAGATSSNVLVGDARDMTKFLEDLTAGKWSLQRAFSKLDTVAQQSDAATRQVIYEDSIKKGMSHQQALMRTLESMNFSRRGTSPSMYLLASLTPFMHSQVQGLDVLYRSMRGQLPGADKLQVAQRFAARATMLAVSSLAYAAVMQDDEDYKRAKPEERYGYWWVPTLGLTKENWLKIPIPYEIGFLFKALPEAMVNTAFGDEKAKPALSALWKALGQSVPLDIPQALKPALEVRLGSSLFSGDIESSREKEILPQYRYRTNSTEIAKMLGGAGGLSPIQIDYLIRGYTGGVGMAIAQMANVFLRAPEAENVAQPTTKLSEVPLIGSLFQTTEGRGALDATYNLIEEIQQYKGAYNKLIQDGKPEEAAKFANENASVLAASSMAGYMKKTLGEMAKQARIIKSSPQMTTEQKDAALENLYISQLALSRNFLKNAERTTLR
jgi:hypothetical protein